VQADHTGNTEGDIQAISLSIYSCKGKTWPRAWCGAEAYQLTRKNSLEIRSHCPAEQHFRQLLPEFNNADFVTFTGSYRYRSSGKSDTSPVQTTRDHGLLLRIT
jgi:hypothetical protein